MGIKTQQIKEMHDIVNNNIFAISELGSILKIIFVFIELEVHFIINYYNVMKGFIILKST